MPLFGLRALVVDADPSNAKLLLVILRAEGADARSASSAESALSLFWQYRPHLVLTEIVLPGVDGLELARQLRAAEPTTVIVVVTSRNGPAAAGEARAAGANEYVRKPIDPVAFSALLVRVMTVGGEHEDRNR